MSATYAAGTDGISRSSIGGVEESRGSGVSWAAVFAGALAAAVLSFLLFLLGIGLGLSSVSVWSGQGSDGETVGWGAIAWIFVTQLASAGLGGYIAGRLRTRWTALHSDEVYFRDTIHGFLSWSLATLFMVAVMGSALGALVAGTAKMTGAVASGAAQVVGHAAGAATDVAGSALSGLAGGAAANKADEDGSALGSELSYWTQSLFRKEAGPETHAQDIQDTVSRMGADARSAAADARDVAVIFRYSLASGKLSEADARYIAGLISARSNLAPADAEKKVQEAFREVQVGMEKAKRIAQEAVDTAKQAAEATRKAAAYTLLWIFAGLLLGAFVASLCATWGGRERDA